MYVYHVTTKVLWKAVPADTSTHGIHPPCGVKDGLCHLVLLSHAKFAKKFDLPFPLLADHEKQVCEAYGVWKEKSMYGRKYMGMERSTFLVGSDGRVKKVWRKVSVTGHAADVLKAAQAL